MQQVLAHLVIVGSAGHRDRNHRAGVALLPPLGSFTSVAKSLMPNFRQSAAGCLYCNRNDDPGQNQP